MKIYYASTLYTTIKNTHLKNFLFFVAEIKKL